MLCRLILKQILPQPDDGSTEFYHIGTVKIADKSKYAWWDNHEQQAVAEMRAILKFFFVFFTPFYSINSKFFELKPLTALIKLQLMPVLLLYPFYTTYLFFLVPVYYFRHY